MSDDCLKLTTYAGERDRAGRRPLADALLDLYGEHGLQASVLLRGSEGFGRLHHLHTDRLLTLSEDLPAVTIAIDDRRRIESILEQVLRVKRRGLITLERARLLAGELGEVRLPVRLREAAKLTVYLGRQDRVGGAPAFVAITELLYRRGIAGASVLLGVDGTRSGRRSRARLLARNADVPMVVLAVGSGERIAAVLPELSRLVAEPVVTLERVRICKRDGELLARPNALPRTDAGGLGLWQMLTIYSSQAATVEGRPLSAELVRRLRRSDAAGATSLRGVWGFHGSRPPHGDRLLQLRRHVPVVTVVIDTPQQISRSFEIVDELTREHGLVTSEMVPAVSAISAEARMGGMLLAELDY